MTSTPAWKFRGWPAVGLLLALMLTGCGGPSGGADVPRPDPSTPLDPEVADLVERMVGEVEGEPDNPGKWVLLAMAYQANDLFEPARASYEEALRFDEAQPRWWYQLAKVRRELGDLDGALEAMGRVIELEAGYGPAYWRRGQWQMEQGRPEAAEADFRKAVELDGEDPEALLGLARVHLELGRSEEAAALMERLIALDPRDPQAHQVLATAYRQLKRMDEAAKHLALTDGQHYVRTDTWATDVLRFQVGYGDRLAMAQRYETDGQLDAAVTLYGDLLSSEPDDVRVMTRLARVLLRLERLDEARPLLERAVELQPDDADAHFELAGYLLKAGELDAALRQVDRAIEIDPQRAPLHHRRGLVLKALARFDEAVPALSRALELSPGQPNILVPLGDCLGRLGHWPQAGQAYQLALEQQPQDADLRVRLGLALLRVGQLPQAEAELTRALELGPARPREVSLLLERIRRERAGNPGRDGS